MSSGASSDTELNDLENGRIYGEKAELPETTDFAEPDWDGPDDPENPKNWPLWRRWYITFVVAWMCLVVTFGSSIFVSGTDYIAFEFGTTRTVALIGLSLYLIGLACGPTIAAPISETVGRRPVYFTSIPISMLFSAGVGNAHNFGTVLVCRFFAGFFASPVLAVAGGTIQDLWNPDMVGAAMCGFCLAPFAGPVLGPIIGGFLIEKRSWNWTIDIQTIILKRRAKKRGLALPPKLPTGEALKLVFMVTLQRPFAMLVFEPIVLALSLYMSFVFAVLFGFFEAFPFVFTTVYDFNSGDTGLTFLGIGVGLLIGAAIYLFLDRTKYVPAMRLPVPLPPESRLLPAKIGAVALPIGLFWLAWTSRKSVHWIVPVLSGVPFGMALILLFFTVATYFTLCYPAMATASALAANNMLRYLMAAGFPLFTIQMYEKMGIDWATSFYGFVALAMLPVPWALGRYGARLRAGSRYGLQEEMTELKIVQSI
ncbi:major facilitator superfamily domain-containing protein [Lipomyces starkeyi]